MGTVRGELRRYIARGAPANLPAVATGRRRPNGLSGWNQQTNKIGPTSFSPVLLQLNEIIRFDA